MTLSEIRVVQQEFRDLVHEALSYGPNPILSRRYLEIRSQFQANYPEIRPNLGRLWTTVADPTHFPSQHTDPIESILEFATLEGLLLRDARLTQRDLEDIETAFDICGGDEVSHA